MRLGGHDREVGRGAARARRARAPGPPRRCRRPRARPPPHGRGGRRDGLHARPASRRGRPARAAPRSTSPPRPPPSRSLMPAEPLPPGGRLAVEEAGDALVARIANEARANALDEALLDGLVSLLNGPRAGGVPRRAAGGRRGPPLLGGPRPGRPAARGARRRTCEDGARRIQAAARAIAGCAVPVVGVRQRRRLRRGPRAGDGLRLAHRAPRRAAGDARGPARGGLRARRPAALRRGPRPGTHAAAVPDRRARGCRRGARDRPGGPGGGAGRAVARGPRRRGRRGRRRPPRRGRHAGARAARSPRGRCPPEVDRAAGDWVARAFASDDFREGLAAFRERRPPHFRGR